MRLDARTRSAEVLQAWAAGLDLPFIAVLRESQTYVKCIEKGLSLFDLPPAQVQSDLAQWQPILDWLAPILQPAPRAIEELQRSAQRFASARTAPGQARIREVGPPAPEAASTPAPPASRMPEPKRNIGASPITRLLGALPIPRFLQRTS